MIIFPAIDIKGGKCVRLFKGSFEDITKYNKSPLIQAKEFSNLGFNNIHIIDLDGAQKENPINENLIKEISKIKNIKIQVGGGVRSLERIEKLGQMGDVVKVKDGFARNYLIPQKKALRASENNIEYFEKEKVQLEAINLEQKQEAEKILDKLDNFNLIIIRQAGETGQLYGSVSNNDIKNSLSDNGFIVEKNQIKLDKPIKTLGIHSLAIKLHPEVQATISLIVSRTESEAKSLLKGNAINIEDEVLTSEETIDLEEVFEEGAIPENIGSEDTNEENSEIAKEELDEEEILEDISETKEAKKEE